MAWFNQVHAHSVEEASSIYDTATIQLHGRGPNFTAMPDAPPCPPRSRLGHAALCQELQSTGPLKFELSLQKKSLKYHQPGVRIEFHGEAIEILNNWS
jgi:hypothetical protein